MADTQNRTLTGRFQTRTPVLSGNMPGEIVLGIQGPRGPVGPQGVPGKDFKYEDFTPEQLEKLRGPAGAKGEPGKDFEYKDFTAEQLESLRGPQGIPGKDGTGIAILDTFNSVEELNAAHPTGSRGEAYMVGTTLYIWSEAAGKWADAGNVQGAEGPVGPQGIPGERGPAGKSFTYDDFTAEQLEALRGPAGPSGPPGEPGKTPQRGTDYWTPDDIAAIKAYVEEAILGGAW